MSLIDVDPAPLRAGWSRGDAAPQPAGKRPARVTVGSFGAEWVEGTGPAMRQPGRSEFHHRRHPDVPGLPGSDLCASYSGNGGTAGSMADATPPDARGWQRISVGPWSSRPGWRGSATGSCLRRHRSGVDPRRRAVHVHMSPTGSSTAGTRTRAAPYLTVGRPGGPTAAAGAGRDCNRKRPACPPARPASRGTRPATPGPAGPSASWPRLTARTCPAPDPDGRPGRRARSDAPAQTLAGRVTRYSPVGPGGGRGGQRRAGRGATSGSPPPAAIPCPGHPRTPPFGGRGRCPAGRGRVAVIDELDKVHPTPAT